MPAHYGQRSLYYPSIDFEYITWPFCRKHDIRDLQDPPGPMLTALYHHPWILDILKSRSTTHDDAPSFPN